jgi:hypothetical protein
MGVVTGVTPTSTCGTCNQNPCVCVSLSGNNPYMCPNTFVSSSSVGLSITGTSVTTGWGTQGSPIINSVAPGNISMSLEAYTHYVFDPHNEKHMEAYAQLTEKGDWPDWFKEELRNYGVKIGDQPSMWRDLLDLKIHKAHGGFCANREQLLLDFLQWAEAGDIYLASAKSGDTDARYEPLDDADAAELVRAYLDSGL